MIAILLLLLPSIASALNGNGRQAFVTYDGWRAFELVTQGDKLDGFEMPGNMDGIGVSSIEYLDSLIVSRMPSCNTLIQSTSMSRRIYWKEEMKFECLSIMNR